MQERSEDTLTCHNDLEFQYKFTILNVSSVGVTWSSLVRRSCTTASACRRASFPSGNPAAVLHLFSPIHMEFSTSKNAELFNLSLSSSCAAMQLCASFARSESAPPSDLRIALSAACRIVAAYCAFTATSSKMWARRRSIFSFSKYILFIICLYYLSIFLLIQTRVINRWRTHSLFLSLSCETRTQTLRHSPALIQCEARLPHRLRHLFDLRREVLLRAHLITQLF